MKMAGDCDTFEDEFAYIFELTDNRIRKPSLLRGFLPIILAFPNLMPSVEAVSGLQSLLHGSTCECRLMPLIDFRICSSFWLFSPIWSLIFFHNGVNLRTGKLLFTVSSKLVCKSGSHRMMTLHHLLPLDHHRYLPPLRVQQRPFHHHHLPSI